MVEIEYEHTASDFAEGQVTASKLLPNARRMRRWSLFVGTILIIAPLVATATGGALSLKDPRPWIVVLLGVYVVLAMTVLQSFHFKRQFKKNPHLQGKFTARFDESGISFIGPESRGEMQWSNLDTFKESKNLFVLVRMPSLFHIYPKRAFSPDQLNELRSLLANNLAKKTPAKA